jgi:hypothetical protein
MTSRLFDENELTQLRVQLGEAVIDGGRWRPSLEQLCRVAGAEGASLRQSGIRTPDVPYTASVEHLTKIYFREGWHLRDTRVSAFAKKHAKRSGAFVDGDLFTNDEFKSLLRRDPYYNDFLGANKFRWGAGYNSSLKVSHGWSRFRERKRRALSTPERETVFSLFRQHFRRSPIYRRRSDMPF